MTQQANPPSIPEFQIRISDIEDQIKANLKANRLGQNSTQQELLNYIEANKVKRSRVPGKITNLKQEIVSGLLEVFRPLQEDKHRFFEEKKLLVCTTISTIYAERHKSEQDQLQLKKYGSLRKSGFIKANHRLRYSTPLKRTTSSGKVYESTIATSKYLSTDRKINFNRQEVTFSTEEVEALRKRAGIWK